MAKRITKRAKAQAERAAKVKAVQATGYTKRAASKFVESVKDRAASNGRPLTAKDLAEAAETRREGAIKQSRMGKTERGKKYAAAMAEREQIAGRLKSQGIIAAQFEDLAAAAVEGRYYEALALNRQAYADTLQKIDEAIDELKQELSRLTGDERFEVQTKINILTNERETLEEQASRYGIGKALNIKNTSSAKILGKLL